MTKNNIDKVLKTTKGKNKLKSFPDAKIVPGKKPKVFKNIKKKSFKY